MTYKKYIEIMTKKLLVYKYVAAHHGGCTTTGH